MTSSLLMNKVYIPIGVILLLLTAALPAAAHKVEVFAWVEGDTVKTRQGTVSEPDEFQERQQTFDRIQDRFRDFLMPRRKTLFHGQEIEEQTAANIRVSGNVRALSIDLPVQFEAQSLEIVFDQFVLLVDA